jgi:excisionase family DNA binding protein
MGAERLPLPEDRVYVTPAEFVRFSGLPRSTVAYYIDRGKIPSLRLGKRVLIPRAALEELLERLLRGAA